jgi:trimethylamine--corrinoid protein Co-methyltransferase
LKRNLHSGLNLKGNFTLEVFTPDELAEIHYATIEVLEKTGIFVDDEEALDIFDGGGARVDRKTKTVKIPSYLLEECIRTAPHKLVLYGRNPKNNIILERNRVHFTNFGEAVNIVDPFTGELRPPTKQDVANSAKLVDALDGIDLYERAMIASDVPAAISPLHIAEAYFANTSKHCHHGPGDSWLGKYLYRMAAVVAGGKDKLKERPIISSLVCPVSPLQLVADCCQMIITGARWGVPINVLSMGMSGATMPVTLAGTLVTHNAEVLSGLVLSQLTVKGAPFIYGSSTTSLDLRLTSSPVGNPELGMISAAVAKLAQYYLLPSFVAGG